jgi:hypothetical protein
VRWRRALLDSWSRLDMDASYLIVIWLCPTYSASPKQCLFLKAGEREKHQIPDPKPIFLRALFLLLFLDPGSGLRDPGSGMGKKSGSGINIPDPQHCMHL